MTGVLWTAHVCRPGKTEHTIFVTARDKTPGSVHDTVVVLGGNRVFGIADTIMALETA